MTILMGPVALPEGIYHGEVGDEKRMIESKEY
jgi:hypothetical protein